MGALLGQTRAPIGQMGASKGQAVAPMGQAKDPMGHMGSPMGTMGAPMSQLGASMVQMVASMARQMVTQFGMSQLGPMALEGGSQEVFLGRDLMTRSDVSDAISKQIDGHSIGVHLLHP